MKTALGFEEPGFFNLTADIPRRYRIVQGIDLKDIENAVNSLIDDGWVPLGAPQVSKGETALLYSQAMTIGIDRPVIVHSHAQEFSDEFGKQLRRVVKSKLR